MTPDKKDNPLWDDWDGEYLGNIWGWNFSFIALAVILLLGTFMFCRYQSLEKRGELTPVEQPVDTSETSPPAYQE